MSRKRHGQQIEIEVLEVDAGHPAPRERVRPPEAGRYLRLARACNAGDTRTKHSGNTIVGFYIERAGWSQRLSCSAQGYCGETGRRRQMFRTSVQPTATIVCDAARAAVPVPAIGDWHDVAGHHRYYGSSSFNDGERTFGKPPTVNVFGIWSRQQPQSMISHRHL
jgi:hypothetical protein